MRTPTHKTSGKVLASVALLAAAAGVAGLGTYGSFTSTTSASESVASGTVVIGLSAAGPANRLSIPATGLVPGDTVQRAVTLNNTGDQDLASLTLTTAATPSSVLDSDGTNGLQLVIDSCSAPWTETGSAPAYTYTCSGTTKTVLTGRVIQTNAPLNGLASLAHAGSDNLRVTMTLPATADNTFQGKSSTIAFGFTGTQRVAAAH